METLYKHKSSKYDQFPFYMSKLSQTMLDQTEKWEKSIKLYDKCSWCKQKPLN